MGVKELVLSLNKAHSAPVPEAQLDKLFSVLWDDLDKQIASIPKAANTMKHNRPQGEILEELVSSVRSVEMRVRDLTEDEPMARRRRRPRLHPAVVSELMHRVADGPGDPIQILIIASLLRDDAPWIYELGQEAYRAVRLGRREERSRAIRRFAKAIELLQRGPFSEEFGVDRLALKAIRPEFLEILDLCKFEGDDEKASELETRKRNLTEKEE
jgi:hypothetical protein